MSQEPFYLPSARRPTPGRPRKYPRTDETAPRPSHERPPSGHTSGTPAVQVVEKKAQEQSTLAWHTIGQIPPRLLDLKDSARYLSVSTWVLRGWEANGVLKRVRVPGLDGKDLDKILFDRTDLDALVTTWK